MQFRKKLKVLLINGDMDKVFRLCEIGLLPGHHLFGTLQLQKDYGIDVEITDSGKFPIFNKIGNWIDVALLDQQISALLNLRKFDIIYAPFGAMNTKLIILFKLLGLVRKPVVILVHHPLFGKPSSKKWKRFLVKKLILKYDAIIFFSKKMRKEVIDTYGVCGEHADKYFTLSPLGADYNTFRST